MSQKLLLFILHVLLIVSTKTGVEGSGHSAEGADRRESSRIMTVSELDHVYPQPSMGYVSYKGSTPVYSSASSSSYSRERPGRQILSSLPPSYPLAMASSYGHNVGSSENLMHLDHVASPSEGWSSGGGGGDGYVKGDCNSALGLLGVLGLISFLTNVLRHMSTTTARSMLPSRKKRSDMGRLQHDHDNVEELNRVTNLMLPLFTAVAHAKDSLIPKHCVYREICEANESLVHTLGARGYALGRMLTDQVAQMLTSGESFYLHQKVKKSQMEWILEAGKLGRRLNKNLCELQYDHCKVLEMLPKYVIPSAVLQNQVHV